MYQFFADLLVNRWNSLDKSILEATTVNQFKKGLQKLKQSRMGFFKDWNPFNPIATSLLQVWCGHTRYITRYIFLSKADTGTTGILPL